MDVVGKILAGDKLSYIQFSKISTWGDILLSTIVGGLVGAIGGEGALNANYLNHAKKCWIY